MKIFSNFDTKAPLKAYQEALAAYGADKIMFFRRDRIYLTFFVILPAIAVGLCFGFVFFLWRSAGISNFRINAFLVTVASIVALMVIVKITFNYINYLLDYTIVTPFLITSYNQTGLFKREIRTVDTDKVKAITISGDTFFQSLFNYGSLILLTEGDEENQGDISLHYLNDPASLKDEVVRVINLDEDE